MTEMAGKLRGKFHWHDDPIKAAIRHIVRVARIVKPLEAIKVLADEPDNRILECAQWIGADVIITGDKHLLNMTSFEGIEIIRIADFLREWE